MIDVSGHLVPVVGPSGAGKDSILRAAQDLFAGDERVVFPRRVVTRTAMADAEDHDSMSVEQFEAAAAEGRFALAWSAHGLRYGLPVTLEDDLRDGRLVMANLSRSVIPQVMERYPTALVVEIIADRDVIAARLASRGREDAEEIRERLDRSVPVRLPSSTVRIDNSGPREIAGERADAPTVGKPARGRLEHRGLPGARRAHQIDRQHAALGKVLAIVRRLAFVAGEDPIVHINCHQLVAASADVAHHATSSSIRSSMISSPLTSRTGPLQAGQISRAPVSGSVSQRGQAQRGTFDDRAGEGRRVLRLLQLGHGGEQFGRGLRRE